MEKKLKEHQKSVELKNEESKERIKELESKLSKQDKQIKILNDKISASESKEKSEESLLFKCKECDFTTLTKQGMKTHEKRKHTRTSKQIRFPRSCELCDKKIRKSIELKQHIKTHSYNSVDYKCVECDFMGSNDTTMEVHMGKVHCEKIECGICDNVFNNLEALETHLSTCEVYKCDECGFITTKLVVVKIHLDKEHNGGTEMQINHLKQSTANREEYDCYFYKKRDLFATK